MLFFPIDSLLTSVTIALGKAGLMSLVKFGIFLLLWGYIFKVHCANIKVSVFYLNMSLRTIIEELDDAHSDISEWKRKTSPVALLEKAGDEIIGAVNNSLETWEEVITHDLFEPATVMWTNRLPGERDGLSLLDWTPLEEGVVAESFIWYFPSTKEIIEMDVAFSSNYKWSTTGEADSMDLQNVATHEFGHGGLDDLGFERDSRLTMYQYGSLGETSKRTLGAGDIKGWRRLYGDY